MDATVNHQRDGSVKRAQLLRAQDYHRAQLLRIEEELGKAPGAVSTKALSGKTRKWLEGMSTPRLRMQAIRVGLEPDDFEELGVMVSAIMERMGVV